jgi:metal-sulfur cluster biosynthetic enzyme
VIAYGSDRAHDSDQGWSEMTNNEDLAGRIREALRVVIDPELGYNTVDLGFVYDISVIGGVAHITMTATSRGCPAAAFLKEGVANSGRRVPGIGSVDVVMTFDPPWRPSMIAPGVRTSLGFAEVN